MQVILFPVAYIYVRRGLFLESVLTEQRKSAAAAADVRDRIDFKILYYVKPTARIHPRTQFFIPFVPRFQI